MTSSSAIHATTPYNGLPPEAFWKTAVAERSMFDLEHLWRPKYEISPDDRIASFGSCFAQHIGRALRTESYQWLITERPPAELTENSARKFNYDLFTCRTGNIYTTSLLRQWTDWTVGNRPQPDEFWEAGDRVLDPFRPRVEPNGFVSLDEMRRSREVTVKAFGEAIKTATIFVFTLGLTESWENSAGYEYPMCPGTAGGVFDPAAHHFVNQRFDRIVGELKDAMSGMRRLNPSLKFLLTVSPVPLTATASGQHCLVATTRSKSVLRAVAAEFAETDPLVDYFPSYEIIASPPVRGIFFEPNMRSVNQHGVSLVMSHFFKALSNGRVESKAPERTAASSETADLVCEEQLLAAFGARS